MNKGFGIAWCRWAVAHRRALRLVWLGLAGLSLLVLVRTRIDSDWLHLFRRTDPVLQRYRRYAGRDENARSLYVRLDRPAAAAAARKRLRAVPGVALVERLPGLDAGGSIWLLILMRPGGGAQERTRILRDIHRALLDSGAPFTLTGAAQIMLEFQRSVRRDFIFASLVSMALVGGLLALAFGAGRVLLWCLFYEILGLLVAMALCVLVFGPLNVLAAALPCVLLGLGADFIIHCLAAAAEEDSSAAENAVRIYHRVAVPMFWGAATTAAAFAGLGLADLQGLAQVGFLGAAGIICMFAVILLALPPLLHEYPKVRFRSTLPPWIPQTPKRRALAGTATAVVCLGISFFALRLQPEERLENLYDPTMPSLRLQRQLAAQLGSYPSTLYLAIDSTDPTAVKQLLNSADLPFTIDPLRRLRPDTDAGTSFILPLMGHRNPFVRKNYDDIAAGVAKLQRHPAIRRAVLTGDATISLHLNQLLQRGMLRALILVFILLALILTVSLRSWRLTLMPLATLAVAMLGILGFMGLAGITLSAYTLTLIPVFVGIGIDDLLYVTHAFRSGRTLARSPSMAGAITLTSATTILGYGSLLTARNPGFRAMGFCAVIGLGVMYAGAVFLLPPLLGKAPGNSCVPLPDASAGHVDESKACTPLSPSTPSP